MDKEEQQKPLEVETVVNGSEEKVEDNNQAAAQQAAAQHRWWHRQRCHQHHPQPSRARQPDRHKPVHNSRELHRCSYRPIPQP